MTSIRKVTPQELRELIVGSFIVNRFKAEVGGYHVLIAPQGDRAQRVRVYVDGHGGPDLQMPKFSRKGEDRELDAQWRKYNAAEVKLMRAVVATASRKFGLDLGTLSFTRKAGCSCPCSPGFVSSKRGNFQVHITKK